MNEDAAVRGVDAVSVGHTPGPWVAHHLGDTIYIGYPKSWHPTDVYDIAATVECDVGFHAAAKKKAHANAALIAAAPDLLAALEPFAVFACSPEGECDCHNCHARDVIRKARGQNPVLHPTNTEVSSPLLLEE